MFTPRRAGERHHVRRRNQDAWRTFFPRGPPGPLSGGFGALLSLEENRLPPGARAAPQPRQEVEHITYILRGALAQDDSTGRSGILRVGEFQSMTTGRRVRQHEQNASQSNWAHVFRLSLRPSQPGLERAQEQRLFPAAERRGALCLVASPDGRLRSLRVHQDALLYSSILDVGQHLVHELAPGRSAWLHVVSGAASLDDLVLVGGDGIGVTDELAVSLTAREETELLLLDLGPQPAGTPER